MKATDTEKRMMRWIEPGRPIRRQLERWACRRGQKWAVNLAILHACSNVSSRFIRVIKANFLECLRFSLFMTQFPGKLDLMKHKFLLAIFQIYLLHVTKVGCASRRTFFSRFGQVHKSCSLSAPNRVSRF
ncbi:unnamed protein product [Meloidogyne enterolobii]|uniref:Uncharacterized protein n=1 Tax=Meloidogyne enterolobii TaxID=390850 RepID=A0ACB1AS70_MELEN